MSSGLSINNILEHRRADGYLIYYWNANKAKGIKYEKWRSEVCHRRRDKKTWLPFREGKYNPLVLTYALLLYISRR